MVLNVDQVGTAESDESSRVRGTTISSVTIFCRTYIFYRIR